MNDEFIELNGITVHYHEYPKDGAETLIFLHYGGSNLMAWNGMLSFFLDRFCVVLPDLRGHGHSSKPTTGYHIDDFSSDILALMDHLSIDRAYLVGSSLGAMTAVSLAANHPDRVLALSLESRGYSNPYGEFGLESFETEEEEEVSKEKIRAFFSQDRPPQIYESIEARIEANRVYHEKNGWDFTDEVIEFLTYSTYQHEDGTLRDLAVSSIWSEYMELLWKEDLEDYYKRITCPVLIFPEDDDIAKPTVQAAIKQFTSYVPHSKVVHIEGSAHAYNAVIHTERYSQEILQFIDELNEI
ncbi:MAG: alpha/beta fold hydrolase [Candidatus Kariarchaeaceae archaeon]